PAVWVIRVWAVWSRSRSRIVVRRARSSGADDRTRRDTGGNAAPTWPIIAAPVATSADVDVPVDVDVAAPVDAGAVEVPAIASGGTGPGTSPSGTPSVNATPGDTATMSTPAGGETATVRTSASGETATAAATAASGETATLRTC